MNANSLIPVDMCWGVCDVSDMKEGKRSAKTMIFEFGRGGSVLKG